jgi:hypothetical protein
VSAYYLHFVHHNPVFQKLAQWSSVAPIRPISLGALHLRMGTDPVLKSSVPFGILDTGHKSKNFIISSVTQNYENPLQLKYLSIRFLPFCLSSSHYKMLKWEMNSVVHIEPPPSVVCHLCSVMYEVHVLYICQWSKPYSDSRPAGYELCIEFYWK